MMVTLSFCRYCAVLLPPNPKPQCENCGNPTNQPVKGDFDKDEAEYLRNPDQDLT